MRTNMYIETDVFFLPRADQQCVGVPVKDHSCIMHAMLNYVGYAVLLDNFQEQSSAYFY